MSGVLNFRIWRGLQKWDQYAVLSTSWPSSNLESVPASSSTSSLSSSSTVNRFEIDVGNTVGGDRGGGTAVAVCVTIHALLGGTERTGCAVYLL